MLSATASPAASVSPVAPRAAAPSGRLPLEDARLQGRLWRGSSLGASTEPTLPSGFTALDAELPGGGWPLRAVTELLMPEAGVLEWRLLAPALRRCWAEAASVAGGPGRHRRTARPPRRMLLVNPPHQPHLTGLQALGLPAAALVWVAPQTPTEALWATEQALQSGVAVLAWLPQARPEQIRRLQVHALGSQAPVFLLRPEGAAAQSSAAPLRLRVRPGPDWALEVQVFKRRGPAHEGWLALDAVPGALEPLLTAARRKPQPAPTPTPHPGPVRPAPERPHALARPVLHA